MYHNGQAMASFLAEMTDYVIVTPFRAISSGHVCMAVFLKGNCHACAQNAFIHADDTARQSRAVHGVSDQAVVTLCEAPKEKPFRPAGRRPVVSYPLRDGAPGHRHAPDLPILPRL